MATAVVPHWLGEGVVAGVCTGFGWLTRGGAVRGRMRGLEAVTPSIFRCLGSA